MSEPIDWNVENDNKKPTHKRNVIRNEAPVYQKNIRFYLTALRFIGSALILSILLSGILAYQDKDIPAIFLAITSGAFTILSVVFGKNSK